MKVYSIIYYLKEAEHSCGCGCEGEHDHEHNHEVRDNYEVEGTIKTFGAWANIMPDSYLVKTELSAKDMKEKLMEVLEDGDILLVSEIDRENTATSINGAIEWIRA